MIRTPSGKNLMNEQEAIQWLLDNNALPFQCTADYVGGAEIGLGTIVNPTPAKVRVGSLIFFADSKVSTVIAITSNSFICSDEYNDLVDDIVYVSNVQLNASGHLIVTLSNGTNIDAGLIKQIASFSINASQHLIATYNDGTTTDLGAIFSGNITVSGNLTVTGGISGNAVTGNSIVENMSGYSFTSGGKSYISFIYASAVKNGNKLTFVVFGKVEDPTDNELELCRFVVPSAVATKLVPYTVAGANYLAQKSIEFFKTSAISFQAKSCALEMTKQAGTDCVINIRGINTIAQLEAATEYTFRIEFTFLLSDNMAS